MVDTVIPRPPHAYVPGVTLRHAEDWFDGIKDSVRVGMTHDQLVRCKAYRAGVIYLREGFNWECHEVLEAVWMVLPEGPDRAFVQAVIQLANARLKQAMGKPRAVLRLCDIVDQHLSEAQGANPVPGLPRTDVERLLREARGTAEKSNILQNNAI